MGDMDSGNSGSIQSSSTGGGVGGGCDDQEFDSGRSGATESISAFLSSYNNINMGITSTSSAAAVHPLQLYSFNNGSSSFASSNNLGVPNYFSSLESPNFNINGTHNHNHNHNHGHNNNTNDNNSNSNSNNPLDMVWANNKFPSIRPPTSTNDTICTTEGHLAYTITNTHQPPGPTPPAHGPAAPAGSSPRAGSGKNPKKRSRASRRAPTTVLTTDTTNFRQMVQEFTGIPAPPFTAFTPRTRFDLFSGLGGHSSNNSSVVQPPSYLLRPFPQKIAPLHQPQFLGTTTIDTNTSTNTVITSSVMNTASLIMNDALGLAAVSSTAASNTNALPPTTFQVCDPQDYLSSTTQQVNFQSFLETPISVSASSSALALNDKYSLPALVHQDSGMSSTAQMNSSINPEGGIFLGISATSNGALDNIGSVTKGSEGMVDSWICSSD